MLIPRRVKHRKQHHPGRSGAAKGGTEISFGDFAREAQEVKVVGVLGDLLGQLGVRRDKLLGKV